MKTVIYHSADFDGIFCREIAKRFLGTNGVNYVGWNFGDPPLSVPDGELYVLDLPLDRPFGFHNANDWPHLISTVERKVTLTWIDHHKTSIETHPRGITGYRIDGVAACRLAWQWFSAFERTAYLNEQHPGELPLKTEFIDRNVDEPLAVRLAGEYDVWDHRGDGDLEFQFGLRCGEPDWEKLLGERHNGNLCTAYTFGLIERGKAAMAYSQHVDADLVTHKSFRVKWEGLDFLCLNHGRFNSLTFAAMDKPETGHDALMGFMWNGKVWTVSLYHAAHRKDIDLSEIAKKYGGGGHRGACGFTCPRLPFLET